MQGTSTARSPLDGDGPGPVSLSLGRPVESRGSSAKSRDTDAGRGIVFRPLATLSKFHEDDGKIGSTSLRVGIRFCDAPVAMVTASLLLRLWRHLELGARCDAWRI